MNAHSRSFVDSDQQIYRKERGRYTPCSDPCAYSGLMDGWWLIRVQPGSKTIREMVHPATAELAAAAKAKEDQLADIIRKAGEARPTQKEISPQALADWKKFIKKHGSEFNYLEYPSIQAISEEIIQAITTP